MEPVAPTATRDADGNRTRDPLSGHWIESPATITSIVTAPCFLTYCIMFVVKMLAFVLSGTRTRIKGLNAGFFVLILAQGVPLAVFTVPPFAQVVPAGFEPAFSSLRGRRPRPD